MMLSKRLADLKCPRCQTRQPVFALMRTQLGSESFTESVSCETCSAKLRVSRKNSVLHLAILFSGGWLVIWVTGVLPYVGDVQIVDLPLHQLADGLLRFAAYLVIIFVVVIPLTARVLTVEQTS